MADVTPPLTLYATVDWRKFLTDSPPGTRGSAEGALREAGSPAFATPELQLYCDGECRAVSYCEGNHRASGQLFPVAAWKKTQDAVLVYYCRKCRTMVKTYAVRLVTETDKLSSTTVEVAKLGEWPRFCPQMPTKVNALIGPDRDLFFKGRQAEGDGLGVGAFAYYRGIVERQKNQLLDEIIRVARRTNAPPDCIKRLEAAKAETQFSKAVDRVKDAVPPSLLIKGHNPLTLLHAALSRNLHGASDEECLKVAHDIRVVLYELAERLGLALKDEQELNDALSRLLNPAS